MVKIRRSGNEEKILQLYTCQSSAESCWIKTYSALSWCLNNNKIFAGVVDTGEQLIAGVVDTVINIHLQISSRIFEKKFRNSPKWNTWGPGGKWFMKKTWRRKSRVRLPFRYSIQFETLASKRSSLRIKRPCEIYLEAFKEMVQLFGGEVPGQLRQQIVDVLHNGLQQSINQSTICLLWLKFFNYPCR